MAVLAEGKALASSADYRRAARERRSDLVIRRRWLDAREHVPMALFCLLWDGFIAFWYVRVLGAPEAPHAMTLLFAVFPIVHVTIGVRMTYALLAGLVNSTLVGVRGGEVFVRHGPLPWRGNRTLAAASIVRLSCDMTTTRRKKGESHAYRLSAHLAGGEQVALVSDLPTVAQARFIEELVAERLGLLPAALDGAAASPVA